MKIDFIKTDRNKYLLLVQNDPNVNSYWGFYLTDGNKSWDGGQSCKLLRENWQIINFEEIPSRDTKVRTRLSTAKLIIESGYSCVDLSKYSFENPF